MFPFDRESAWQSDSPLTMSTVFALSHNRPFVMSCVFLTQPEKLTTVRLCGTSVAGFSSCGKVCGDGAIHRPFCFQTLLGLHWHHLKKEPPRLLVEIPVE